MMVKEMLLLSGKMVLSFSAVRVISAYGLYVLKFLVSSWSQAFFSAAPPFLEVSADNCSAPSLAQSLKIFYLPERKKCLLK